MLPLELERMCRNGRPVTLAYIDLDNFKTINDELGHPTGDRVLKSVARALASELRRTDRIARRSGDEFAILLPETSESEARLVLERTIRSLQVRLEKAEWPVTTSVGVVTYARPPASSEQIVKHADSVMYQAKRAGKNQTLFESGDAGVC